VKFQLSHFAALSMVMLGAILLPVWTQNPIEASPEEYRVDQAVFGLMDHMPKEDLQCNRFQRNAEQQMR
jgi:hypothetical protein